MTARDIALSIAILAAGAAVVAYYLRHPIEAEPAAPSADVPIVEVAAAAPATYRPRIRSQGTVTPRVAAAIASEVAGRVVSVAAAWEAGAFFSEGDVLVEVERSDYELALANAAAQVAQAELRIAWEGEEAVAASAEWERLRSTARPSALVLREPQIKEAEAALRAAVAAKEKAERDLERTRIRAPFAGRVVETLVEIGELVSRGSPVARVHGIDAVEVLLPIAAADLALLDLALGQPLEAPGAPIPVTLRADLGPWQTTWRGRIVRTAAEVDPRTRLLAVIARVDDPFARSSTGPSVPLTPGLFCVAEIDGRPYEDIFVLPRHALRGRDRVVVVDGEGRLRFRRVDVVRVEGDTLIARPAAARGAGAGSEDAPPLAAGERVCVSPIAVVVDGMRVLVEPHATDRGGAESSARGTP
jgi:RND family efflux transporter MFP subunit